MQKFDKENFFKGLRIVVLVAVGILALTKLLSFDDVPYKKNNKSSTIQTDKNLSFLLSSLAA